MSNPILSNRRHVLMLGAGVGAVALIGALSYRAQPAAAGGKASQ